jgi:hypothetical protein
MESLSLEGKAIYETVSASNDKFKAEIHALIVSMVNASVTSAVDLAVERAIDKAVAATVSMAERNMQVYVDGVEKDLRTAMGLASQNTDPEPPIRLPGGVAETSPSGHRTASTTRGLGNGSQPYVPPPARGIAANSAPALVNSSTSASFGSLLHREKRNLTTTHGKPPSMDFPKFCGDNPKFWQARSEDYFAMFDTDPDLWIAVAVMQFEGDAAQWMSSMQHKFVRATWQEFCAAILQCFGKTQHQSLVRM